MNSPEASTPGYEIARERLKDWLLTQPGVSEPAARQLANYFIATHQALGVVPSQEILVLERFFDESGGMQLVLHSAFGIRVNRAWGLALRKRFCRSFNFELQAAATDDAIVLSLGTQHSFPLEEVFHYLSSKTVREVLVQALLDAPMFPIRWRWNASRALALPRQRGGHKLPAPLQRMESENLLAAVFPDQLACLENIVGDREIPEHPLVAQTIEDCLTETMDIDGLVQVLKRIERGRIRCMARDLPEPSPLAHEILNARPYAFLDNAPLEERRTHAVLTRRAGERSNSELGILDPAAIEKVCAEAWPRASNPDELHEALLLAGLVTEAELNRISPESKAWLQALATQKRAGRIRCSSTSNRHAEACCSTEEADASASDGRFWVAAERLPLLEAVFPHCQTDEYLTAPEAERNRIWEPENALRELVRGRLEISGPVTAESVTRFLRVSRPQVDTALLALEGEGFVLRGKFHPKALEVEWCERRLLARIHRLTINRLRAEIQPVSLADFQRFLLAWQRADVEHRAQGPEGLQAVLELLDGYEIPAGAWEPEVLAARVQNYTPQWLDQLCFTGRVGWGRLSPPANLNGRPFAPVRSSPISVFLREHLPDWLRLASVPELLHFSPDTLQVLEQLKRSGALFFGELLKQRSLLPSRIEQALAELVAQGWVTADSFEGLRALLVPPEKRAPFSGLERRRRYKSITSLEFAGRWSLLRHPGQAPHASATATAPGTRPPPAPNTSERATNAALNPNSANHEADGHVRTRDEAVETFARVLLRRYGVVFRRLLERESLQVSWFDLGRVYRRLEARAEIRGGYFVGGVSGEQFALPEAIALLRSLRKQPPAGECVVISGADPLNLGGILTPGPRIPAFTANRILLRDGLPIAALQGEEIVLLQANELNGQIERSLRTGDMPAALRPYYA